MKKVLITGGAGFIGSNLCDRLLEQGCEVICFDNFSTGQRRFLDSAMQEERFSLVEGDILDFASLTAAMEGVDFVFHLAANADVRFGVNNTQRDLQQNTIGTSHVLEAMKTQGVKNIAFSSTGSVYGEAEVFPTPENAPMPVQTSLYGASKLAGEGLIAAFCEGFDFQAWIFRFVSVLGERYSHGHVYDFYRKLEKDPQKLEVLGNGKQRKSYMYVQDCLDGMLTSIKNCQEKVNILNLGTPTYVEVNDSIGWICNHLGVNPKLEYSGGERGWVGDNPFIFLDCSRAKANGWEPEVSIQDAVVKTVQWLEKNPWIFDRE